MMIGTLPDNEIENNSRDPEIEAELKSGELYEGGNMNKYKFRSAMISNSRKNNEATAEIIRLLILELTSQMSQKLNEIKIDLNSQILQAIDAEKEIL